MRMLSIVRYDIDPSPGAGAVGAAHRRTVDATTAGIHDAAAALMPLKWLAVANFAD